MSAGDDASWDVECYNYNSCYNSTFSGGDSNSMNITCDSYDSCMNVDILLGDSATFDLEMDILFDQTEITEHWRYGSLSVGALSRM